MGNFNISLLLHLSQSRQKDGGGKKKEGKKKNERHSAKM